MNKGQKEAIGLLGLGTFLEYFDLMLYVHMAFFLNDLFFPKTSPNSIYFVSAFTFCSTFIFRPIGAFLFGWIGDNIGRKATVSITTVMMAISSVIIANLPTYQEIGITAAWVITICRILQGMASLGEIVGAEVYITEITKPPIQYAAVTSMVIFATLGSITSLILAYMFINFHNWRNIFWLGALLGIIGLSARVYLRETIDFVDAKRRLAKTLSKVPDVREQVFKTNPIVNKKINRASFLALLLIHTAWPLYFYISYIYCGSILKTDYGFTDTDVMYQNLIVSIVKLCGYISITYFSYKINPFTFIKVKIIIFFPFCLILPFLLDHITTSTEILLLQSFIMLFTFCYTPAMPIFLQYFPVFGRFTAAATTYALSRAIICVITSIGFVYLEQFGKWALLLIIVPVNVGFIWGIKHFLTLEKLKNPYLNRMA